MNWKESQKKWEKAFITAGTKVGYFSVESSKGAQMLGGIISKYSPEGFCLDVGCGILPKPRYMDFTKRVTFIGIDPMLGSGVRMFPFMRAKAERLPFIAKVFDSVVFATSLNHLEDPEKGIKEARRVLKDGGYLYIWNGMNSSDKSHLWAFDEESLRKLITGFEEIDSIRVHPKRNKEMIFIFKK